MSDLKILNGSSDSSGHVHEYEITYKKGDFGKKKQVLTRSNIVKLIEEVNRIPVERDSLYEEIKQEPKKPLIPLDVG